MLKCAVDGGGIIRRHLAASAGSLLSIERGLCGEKFISPVFAPLDFLDEEPRSFLSRMTYTVVRSLMPTSREKLGNVDQTELLRISFGMPKLAGKHKGKSPAKDARTVEQTGDVV
jgi:hypothetical protein